MQYSVSTQDMIIVASDEEAEEILYVHIRA